MPTILVDQRDGKFVAYGDPDGVTYGDVLEVTVPALYLEDVDPTASDDSSLDYAIGDFWVNQLTSSVFVATSVVPAAATWPKFVPGAAVTSNPPVNVTKAAAAVGVAGDAARADHKHDITTAPPATGVGGANAEGVATTLARSDHNHTLRTATGPTDLAIGAVADGEFLKRSGGAVVGAAAASLTASAPVNVSKAAAAVGVAGDAARADHKHDVTTAAPATGVGGANSEGVATTLARSDHNHTLRTTTGPTNLAIGAVADGQALVRSGATIVGSSAPSGVRSVGAFPGRSTTRSGVAFTNTTTNGSATVNVTVPTNFTALTSLKVYCSPTAGVAAPGKDIDISLSWGKDGELINNHTAANTTTVYDLTGTADTWYVFTITPLATPLEPGDTIGITMQHNVIGGSIGYSHAILIGT